MRADRLLAILMLLQRHGRMSARALAAALEVSPRTIYRDIDALSAAGVPVYAERGAGGGCRLVENYRTELTGLTEGEAGALMLLAVPGPLEPLQVGQELRAALRKLYAALPAYRRGNQPAGAAVSPGQANPVARGVLLDWAGWGRPLSTEPAVGSLYQALAEGRQVRLSYRLYNGVEIQATVRPLGLVAKAGTWYAVYETNGKRRAQPVGELLSVELLEAHLAYPDDFDLTAFWRSVCDQVEDESTLFRAVVRGAPGVVTHLDEPGGRPLAYPGSVDRTGWTTVVCHFGSLEEARARLLAFGGSLEVLEPEALRASLADYAEQILRVYSGES